MAGAALGRRRDGVLELASSLLEVPEPVLNHQQEVLESANEILNSNNREYKGNDSQTEESKKSKESKEKNELSEHRDNTDHQSAWDAQRAIGREFLNSQRSILTIAPGNTLSSSRRISYPKQRTPAPVPVSQNCFTCAILSHSPTLSNLLVTPAITLSHLDPTMQELDIRGEQQASSR